ncbi:(p)ppGpp synthetase [Rhodococcus ruber]|uniref:Putative GTP pyrophosphokinase YwaC n=1 Tax=Rhodococcus ruber TaxID=1830 RepID=A0A098BV01_9NOCA|nr:MULTISPECIES: hypothetical protein [Rhodococcus]RIK08800.1 MAG: (p)ppGpp synthetase [Acidobacteriota bacterium]ATQ29577.1 (p)ppGpp synthetase [Rhodococcus ruber]AUM18599.1 (p)ppGpp synthetase [Rhodococcus ruber]AXY54290.1 hypothetical protein YT1_4900 [Rhodococcus ruber]MBD8057214.1 (p)ppGpp synthetase [Rhodococcus ruber]
MAGIGPERTDSPRRDPAGVGRSGGFALEDLRTKVGIVRDEFVDRHGYDPVEHVESWTAAAAPSAGLAGIRITCGVNADVYRLRDLLAVRRDVRVVEARDYIRRAGPDGYRGLCLVVEVPVARSDGVRAVRVEVQIRTGIMESWEFVATRLRTGFADHLPPEMLDELGAAAERARDLDSRIGALHRRMEDRIAGSQQEAPPA